MRPSELAETVLSMKNTTLKADDLWATFEVIENGELGMQDFCYCPFCILKYLVMLINYAQIISTT